MDLNDMVGKVAKGAAGAGIDAAGEAVCGPLWPVVRAVAEPVIERLRDTPDARMHELLQEWAEKNVENQRAAEIAARVVASISDEQFAILRSLAHVRADTAAARDQRERATRSRLRKASAAAAAWHAVWDPIREGESISAAEARLHASRDQFRELLWTATYDPRLVWLEAQIPRPTALVRLSAKDTVVLRGVAFIEVCRVLAQGIGDEAAMGFAVLVNIGRFDDDGVRNNLKEIASVLHATPLYDDILRLISGMSMATDNSDQAREAIIALTASWA